MAQLDLPAIRAGALVSIAICLPAALVAQAIVDEQANSQPTIVYVLYVAVLAGFVAGGWVAAKRSDESPYSSGAVAALGGFVAIQAVGIVARIVGGDSIRIVLIVTNALLAYGCGLLGAAAVARTRSS
ncbi:MAG: hypothetical protein QOI47_593 [Actinomycetota bacterium]|nr:hypothetical protein [Actinomycetota bacterium]